MKTIRLGLGPNASSVTDQLAEQGLVSTKPEVDEAQIHAINLLFLHGILPSTDAIRARQRFIKILGTRVALIQKEGSRNNSGISLQMIPDSDTLDKTEAVYAEAASMAFTAGVLYGALKRATAHLVLTKCHPDCNHCQGTINICHAALAKAEEQHLISIEAGQHMDRITNREAING